MKLGIPVALIAFGVSGVAAAQDSALTLGTQVGAYFPSSGALRSLYGSSIFTIGIAPVNFNLPKANTFSPSFNVITANKNGNKLFLAPLLYGYEVHFAGENPKFIPYARIDAGVAYVDYSLTFETTRQSSKRFLPAGAVELGAVINNAFRVSARYNVFGKTDGLDFNGLQLQFTVSLFKIKI